MGGLELNLESTETITNLALLQSLFLLYYIFYISFKFNLNTGTKN